VTFTVALKQCYGPWHYHRATVTVPPSPCHRHRATKVLQQRFSSEGMRVKADYEYGETMCFVRKKRAAKH
jgi:hypothetical protein